MALVTPPTTPEEVVIIEFCKDSYGIILRSKYLMKQNYGEWEGWV
jgi:hypothetical protein